MDSPTGKGTLVVFCSDGLLLTFSVPSLGWNRVRAIGSWGERLVLAIEDARRSSSSHHCPSSVPLDPFRPSGTPVPSLQALTTLGQFCLLGSSHFRVSPGGITLRCIHCRQRTLFSIAFPPPKCLNGFENAIELVVEDEVHCAIPSGGY